MRNIRYYIRITAVIIASIVFGLIGGSLIGVGVGVPLSLLIVVLAANILPSADPMSVGFITIYVSGFCGFICMFLKSYKLIVSNFW
jgi:hypothetical protein